MPNSFFHFKQFTINQERCAMKVTTDACLFGAWMTELIKKEKWQVQSALDIGTGTGLLSLMLAQETDFHIDAIEIDEDASEQAKQNIAQTSWSEKINILTTSLQNYQPQKKYDLIFSNPPFYEGDLKSPNKEKNKAMHDTALTLDQLFMFASKHLNKWGHVFILLPAKRHTDVNRLIKEKSFHAEHELQVRQSDNHPIFRYLLHLRWLEVANEQKRNSLTIKSNAGTYTDDFISLLRNYYQLF